MQTITSVKNPLIKSLKALSRRQERENAGRILVEGEVMIREALKCGLVLKDVLCVERKADFAAGLSGEAILVPEEVMQAVCDTRTPQGVCASFQAPAPRKAEELPNPVVALDGVQDPGNVGTIWRTADALGADGLLLVNGCADPYGPKTVRASMGACFRLPVWETGQEELCALLERSGLSLYATALREDTVSLERANLGRCAVIIGSEGRGVSRACWNAAARPSASPCGAAVNPSTRPRRHPSSCGRWFARAGWRNKNSAPWLWEPDAPSVQCWGLPPAPVRR